MVHCTIREYTWQPIGEFVVQKMNISRHYVCSKTQNTPEYSSLFRLLDFCRTSFWADFQIRLSIFIVHIIIINMTQQHRYIYKFKFIVLPISPHLITRLHASFTVYQLFASNKSGSLIKWVFIMLCLCLRFCLLFLFQFWCVCMFNAAHFLSNELLARFIHVHVWTSQSKPPIIDSLTLLRPFQWKMPLKNICSICYVHKFKNRNHEVPLFLVLKTARKSK